MNRIAWWFLSEQPQLTANPRQQSFGNPSATTNLRLAHTGKLEGADRAPHVRRSMPDRHAVVESPSPEHDQYRTPLSFVFVVPKIAHRIAPPHTWATDRNRLSQSKVHKPPKKDRPRGPYQEPCTCPGTKPARFHSTDAFSGAAPPVYRSGIWIPRNAARSAQIDANDDRWKRPSPLDSHCS